VKENETAFREFEEEEKAGTEEDIEDLYADDFFWLHERGVDLIFIFSYFHLFRKLYLNVFEYENESA
jgi:hypothetical protein